MGKNDKAFTAAINEKISALEDKSGISDGSHTIGELYYHRMFLFSVICNQNSKSAWKSKQHDDGTMYDDYFIVGVSTPVGDFSYHYHMDRWKQFDVKELAKAPLWDGHTADDIGRLEYL